MKKKKPTHSVFSNFAWSLKMLLKYSKAAFFITALFIPINIGLRYLEINVIKIRNSAFRALSPF